MAVDPGRTRSAGSGYLVAGRYRLLHKLGTGGMGAVWLANDQLLGREVAIKQVLSTAGMDAAQADEQRQRFLREGRIAARLTHPHAIAMYDMALDSGEPWLVMEYLPSRSLAGVLSIRRALPVVQVAQIGAQLADALGAAHAAGVVHRDVKPGNVLIADSGRAQGTVKITDFGISRAQGDVALTQTGIINGTPAYLAPEVARGHETTEASDVFALGSTLFTAVEGVPPFGANDNAMALLHRVAGGEVDRPQRAGALTSVLLWMLEPDPQRRPTMLQARDELARIAAGHSGDTQAVLASRTSVLPTAEGNAGAAPASRPAGTGRGLSATGTRSRLGWLAAGVAVLILAAVVAGVVLASRGSGAPAAAPATSPITTAPDSTTPATTPATASSTPSSTSPSSTAPSSTSPSSTAPSSTAPSSTAVALTADTSVNAVRNYYALLPGGTSTAWNLLGPTLRAQGFDSYNAFWSGFSQINVLSASSDDGGTTVTVTLRFDRGQGQKVVETHRLHMLPHDSGPPLIDSDTLLSSR